MIRTTTIAFALLLPVSAIEADEGTPLHRQIDELILQKAAGRASADRADDAEFLRRVWLDFAGRIPSAQATRDFLGNSDPQKRSKLIEELLAAPTYAERTAEAFHVMLMERRGENPEWRAYLQRSFAANKPWDVLCREILNADGDDESSRGAGFFMSKRLEKYGENPVEYSALTRDIGRLFLGQDLQCAECHNHLFIDDYKQHDFQGLFAVYRNAFIRTDVKFPAVGEKAMGGKWDFVSVFDPTKRQTGPRVPGGTEFDVPPPKEPDPAVKKNPKNVPPRPDFSGVVLLATEITKPDQVQFARNAANRLWFLLMGRGIVQPLDMHHSANPPSHPDLLNLLADQFRAHGFDVKWLLREIALSETYQRTTRQPSPDQPIDPALFLVGIEKRMSAEQLLASVLQATGPLMPAADTSASDASTTTTVPSVDPLRKSFVDAFANDPREPEDSFTATVKGALYWRNDDLLQQRLKRQPGNLIDRLAAMDNMAIQEELYVTILSRMPSESEKQDLLAFLQRFTANRDAAIRDAAWALLSSAEFSINH